MLAREEHLARSVEEDHEVGCGIETHEHESVEPAKKRALRREDVRGVVIGREVAVEDDDPPAPEMSVGEQLSVPLLGHTVRQAKRRAGAPPHAASEPEGRRGRVLSGRLTAALDGVCKPGGGQLMLPGIQADSHVEVPHPELGAPFERPGDASLPRAVAADERHGEASSAHPSPTAVLRAASTRATECCHEK